MLNLRPFQIILIAVFVGMAFVALILLGTFQNTTNQADLQFGSEVVIWGTMPNRTFERTFQNIAQEIKDFSVVSYFSVDAANFDSILVNAIAEGRSPDLVILSSEDLVKHRAKLTPIPFATLPERTFRDSYVDGAEIFTLRDGVYAIPFAVDPLVLYWNRDLFASYGIAQSPATWETVVSSVVPRLTVRDSSRSITQSALAFGEYRNVKHAKSVLMLLAMQSGSQLVRDSEQGYRIEINDSSNQAVRRPLETALEFYNNFSNANNPLYTWNRAQPLDEQTFIAGDVAMYFGRGSEAENLDSKNPNLNFDVAMVPQGEGATMQRTHGIFYGFAIPRAAPNPRGAYAAAQLLANGRFTDGLVRELNLAPVRRDIVAAGDSSAYRSIMLRSALIARAWLDPTPTQSAVVFQQMVEDVTANRSRLSQAVSDALTRLTNLY